MVKRTGNDEMSRESYSSRMSSSHQKFTRVSNRGNCSIGSALAAIAVAGVIFAVIAAGSFDSDGKTISMNPIKVSTFAENLTQLLKAIADALGV